jgi:hypothetical protein
MVPVILLTLAAGPKYVLANQLNVRAQPRADAMLLYVAGIGEECTEKGVPDAAGWVGMRCREFEGYARQEFLSAERPTLEAVRKQFAELSGKNDRAGWDERFAVAQRLLALGESPRTLTPFLLEWFAAENRLAKAANGKPLWSLTPKVPDDSEDAAAAGQQSIARQLGLEVLCLPDEPPASSCRLKEGLRGEVLPDGTAWFVASDWDPASDAKFEAYFQYHAVVTPELAHALGFGVKRDACPMTAAAGLACGTDDCTTCKLQCATECNSARLNCKLGRKSGAWAKCVEAAAPKYQECARRCDAPSAH